MKKHNKKGFTIVELVIVIAVIAILAAVLIPTFSNLVKKANLSNDQQNVRNMNTALAVEVIPDSKFATAGDAINGLYREGWNAGKLETYSNGFHYAYSLEKNTMYLLDETDTVVYPQEEVDKSTLWGLYDDNSNEVLEGIKKYIAITNITSKDHYEASFTSEGYIIDLNGHYIAVGNTSNESYVTADYGIVLSGATQGEHSTSNYTVLTSEEAELYAQSGHGSLTLKNKIITSPIFCTGQCTYLFEDCIFYGNGHIESTYDNMDEIVSITVKNCQFMDTEENTWCIATWGQSVNIIGNTFSNLGRRGAMMIYSDGHHESNVTISGNTFDGIVGANYTFMRFLEGDGTNPTFKSVTIENNNFKSLGLGSGLIRIYSDSLKNAETAAKFTFSNNTVNSSITSDKYIENDTDAGDYKNAFVAGLK